MVKNYMETFVEEIINEARRNDPNYFACTCDECMDSIKAMVLNEIKPFYVTSIKGEVFAQFEVKNVQIKTDVSVKVSKAANLLKARPSHS